MPTRQPNGRWRALTRHPETRRQIDAHKVIRCPKSFAPDAWAQAKAAEEAAAAELHERAMKGVTVAEFRERWLSDPVLLAKDDGTMREESTIIHNRERTKKFTELHGDKSLRAIGEEIVDAWVADRARWGTVKALTAMFNAAASRRGGRLISRNPFTGLGLPTSRGRADKDPPSPDQITNMLRLADELTPPSFAMFVFTGAFSAMRPGELDALKWSDLDFTPSAETIHVRRQWSPKENRVKERPKNGSSGPVVMLEPLRDRLLAWQRVCPSSEWVFPTAPYSRSRRGHMTPSARNRYWDRLRVAAGLTDYVLYEATRHYAGWWLHNVAGLPAEVCATQFRHADRGKTFSKHYSHADRALNLQRIRTATAGLAPVAALPLKQNLNQNGAQRTA